ncbi:MAG: hypothetical protein IKO21_03030 [Fibrobacter sp.]|nr:hypothetical protein [Fibrobacter sp.]
MKKALFTYSFLLSVFFVACGDDQSASSDNDDVEYSSSQDDVYSSENVSSIDNEVLSSSSVNDLVSSTSLSSSSSDSSKVDSSVSSSSVVSVGWSWDVTKDEYFNANIKYGTFIDGRDMKTYKYVSIGKGKDAQLWMAENLNYTAGGAGVCWGYESAYCDVAGALYSWKMAIDSVALAQRDTPVECGLQISCDMPEKIKGVCPDGWHLPSKKEWETLYSTVGGKESAGKVLKARSGWNQNGNGLDDYGFSALPAGSAMPFTKLLSFGEVGSRTDFWTSTPYNISPYTQAYAAGFKSESDIGGLDYLAKMELFSVRCVTDSATLAATPVPTITKEWSWDDDKEIYFNKSIQYETLTDKRDGKTYKTVTIGEGVMKQIWMAENLNYSDSAKTPYLAGHSWCYDNIAENCELAGRLYSWTAAVDSVALANDKHITCGVGVSCDVPYVTQGVCPDGWYLPSEADWEKLEVIIGKDHASAKLKSKTGWRKGGNGEDVYGFSAIPAGYRYSSKLYTDAGWYIHFWQSTLYYLDDVAKKQADTWIFKHDYDNNLVRSSLLKADGGAYVRCLKIPEGEASWDVWSWDVPKESRMNSKISYGRLEDSRDGHVYKTVVIGEGDSAQVWMAENLNYYDDSMTPNDSWCPGNEPSRCDVGGRLYTWATAMQDICPDGWHLPSKAESERLLENTGCNEKTCETLRTVTGWTEPSRYGNGSDDFGFSVLPIGISSSPSNLEYEGMLAYLWTATEEDKSDAYTIMFSQSTKVAIYGRDKTAGRSVRCVKD